MPGLGAMGYAMAKNIRQKIPRESTLYINDINTSTCERFRSQYISFGNIEIVPTARDAAENASVLISIVPEDVHVKAVYLDKKTGVVAAKKDKNRLMLECSTIDVESTKEVGRRLEEEGLGTYVDAPVSVRCSQDVDQMRDSLKWKSGRRACSRTRYPLIADRPPTTVQLI
jgi:3-hydroxyisobutyrate dehydrogenase-like beta-hydroxyacid dehydrogenase